MSYSDTCLIDEITQLRLMYSIRDNMQRYLRGERTRKLSNEKIQYIADNILSAHFTLLKADRVPTNESNVEEKIVNYISQLVNKIEFNIDYNSFRSTNREDDKIREKKVKEVIDNNSFINQIRQEIDEEIKHYIEQGHDTSNIPRNAEPISIFIRKENNSEFFVIKYPKNQEFKRKVWSKNKKYGTIYHLQSSTKKTSVGISDASYKRLVKQGEIVLQKQKVEEAGKKYTPSLYRTTSGLTDKNLIEKEVEFMNSLCKADQKKFLDEVVKKRKEFFIIKNVALKTISEYTNSFAQIDITKDMEIENYNNLMKKLFAIPSTVEKERNDRGGEGRDHYDAKDNFITMYMAKNDFFGNYFSKGSDNDKNYTGHSMFEKQMQHIIDSKTIVSSENRTCKQIFSELLTSTNDKIEDQILKGFREIQSIQTPSLPKALTAEIFTYGIFQEAMRNPENAKLKRMNKILNEFGINIDFKKIEVTRSPDPEIKEAKDQYNKDRNIFNATKKFKIHQEREKEFNKYVKNLGLSEVKDLSVHHFIPIRYNAFIENIKVEGTEMMNTNVEQNWCMTAREGLYAVDLHDLHHRFDTHGEFLLTTEDGSICKCDFNGTRKLYKKNKTANKKMYIMVPILQTKKNDKFYNVMEIPGENREGFVVSTYKDENIITAPPYCINTTQDQQKMQSQIIPKRNGGKDIT